MAITPIVYTGFGNGNTGLAVRTKLNDLGSDVASLSDETKTDTEAIATRVTALEETHTPGILSVASNGMAAQTLVANVAEPLLFMETAPLNIGTAITHNLATSHITIVEAGVYRVYGTINMTAPSKKVVSIELYIDNLPTGFVSSAIGDDTDSYMNFTNTFISAFAINDDVQLYVKSTGTTVTVASASLTIEKTEY